MTALPSWNDTATRAAIESHVEGATGDRVAVFDNDGTLWCGEKPLPIQLDFILRRWGTMAEADPALRAQQPFKAAYEQDHTWLSGAMTKHYEGDDADLKLIMGGVASAFGGMAVDEYAAEVSAFFAEAQHPTLGRPYVTCAYQPMIELLRYLEANGFATYIASGGDRDFMRAISQSVYGIPPERVIGSSTGCNTAMTRASSTRPASTSSTTGRRSRCGSGAAPGGGRRSPAATRTATCRCSASPTA